MKTDFKASDDLQEEAILFLKVLHNNDPSAHQLEKAEEILEELLKRGDIRRLCEPDKVYTFKTNMK